MNKIETIEAKVRELIDLVSQLQSENQRLRSDAEATRLALESLSVDSQNAKTLMAEHRELKRRQALVLSKAEHALQTLQGLK